MRLYSWIKNEKHIVKTLGGRDLTIEVDYEEAGQDWKCNTESHKLVVNVFFPNDNPETKPNVFIYGNKDFNLVDLRKQE